MDCALLNTGRCPTIRCIALTASELPGDFQEGQQVYTLQLLEMDGHEPVPFCDRGVVRGLSRTEGKLHVKTPCNKP